MALDRFAGPVVRGVLVIAAIAVVAPLVAPALRRAGAPLIKSALKSGALAYEKAREAADGLRDMAEDAYAEAVHELREAASARAPAPPPGEAPPQGPVGLHLAGEGETPMPGSAHG